ncbi:hypothetical protein [Arthrobacter crystallopoietes]|nr:hypothetical protein [Arthrobacter crystallopoietes]
MEQRIFRMARAGGIDTNPTTFMQRANTFASAATQYGTTTMLTRREQTGLNGYVIMPAEAARARAALALAHTVGAKSEETQLPDDLGDTPVIGTLTFRPSPVLRETQNGIDPSEFPKLLANTMPEGSWVAVSLRKPSNRERKFHTKWHNYRLGNASPQHHSYSPSAIMISVTAGGASQDEVRALLGQFTSGMPGFDLDTDVRFPKTKHSSWLGVPAGLLLAAATLFGLPQIPLDLPAFTAPSLFAVAGLLLLTGIAGLTGRMRSPDVKLRAKLAAAGFPPPPHRRTKPRPPHKEETIKRTINEGGEKKTVEKHIKAFDGDYPFAPDVFLVGPTVVVGMVSPHAGAISGETVSRERATPPAMLQPIGPLIGTNQDGKAYVSASAQLFGTAIVGRPGTGKAESLDSPIPVPVSGKFPSRWALNRELSVGDKVFTPSGAVTKIAGFSEVFDGDMYEITFSDGQKVKTDAGHLWAVSDRVTRRRDGSEHSLAKMADVDERAKTEAHRLRAVADNIEPGTLATGNDLNRISGVGVGVLLRFVRAAGIDPVQASVVTHEGGVREISRPRVRFDASESHQALMQMATHPSAAAVRKLNLTGLKGQEGSLLTAKEILSFVGVSDPSLMECSTMNARLKRAGVAGTRDVETRMLSTRSTIRIHDVYPVREVLSRYADQVEAGKDRAPRVQLRTTAQLARKVRVTAEGAANWAVDTTAPIAGAATDAPLDPYVLGAWLGDGNTNGPAMTCFDPEIVTEMTAAGYVLRPHKAPGRYGIIGAVEKFRALRLLNNKHIPAIYLRASFEQRLSLLQGLMDTDGTIDQNGACEISLCHERLANDALELIRSLGIKASMTSGPAGYLKNGVRTMTSTRYRIHYTTSLPVFRLSRKAERIPATTRPTQDLLYIESVEPAVSEKVRCLKVEAADGMYLTHGFIPTHNSLLTRTLFGWHCLERVAPSGRPGFPGRNNTLIAFESKGDGVAKYRAWAHSMGDRTLVIDVADPNTPGIDLFAVPGSNEEKALFFTNAMTYTFGKDAIGYRSATTLKAVLNAALAVNDELIESIEGRNPAVIRTGMSPMYYAYLLLAGRSDKVGVELAEGIKARAVKLRERGNPDPVIDAGWAAIAFLYDGTTPSKRAGLTEAPFSKIEDLLALEQWWSPSRRKVTWDQIIDGHKSVVINTGTSATGAVLDDSVNHAISSLLMFSLQNALKRLTSGWLEQQRYVTIFADELSLLSGSSPEVIGWIRDQGRSYGIRAILATQRPEQLGPQLRSNFLTYATLISFSQTDVGTAQEIAANLGGHGEWTQEDIQFLEPFHVVIRSEVDQKRQSAFIVKLPNFEANMASYPAAQGYTEAAA